jgi:hypothetical protein
LYSYNIIKGYILTIKEINKLHKMVSKHKDAYSLGLYTETENTYPVTSEKYQAFNEGRRVRNIKKR